MMIYKKYTYKKITAFFALVMLIIVSCERDIPKDAEEAGFPVIAEVYTDDPVNLTDDFFISFDPNAGANTEGFGTDDNVAYAGTSSIRIDVPDSGDPNGNFIGGIFLDRGVGRDLSGFDALTFWVKGSTSGSAEFGFGTDFEADRFTVDLVNVTIPTYWTQVIIPIPDASKLVQEKGMFKFAAGGVDPLGDGPNGNELAWTFWIDEIKFEKLGTVAQPRPKILDGNDLSQDAFEGSTLPIGGRTLTANLASGQDVTVIVAPSYFSFESSSNTATVDELGVVTVGGMGTAVVTASLDGVMAEGSLTVVSQGALDPSPVPEQAPENVKSIFSDFYENDTESDFSPGFGGSTTQTSIISLADGEVLSYTNNNFTGIIFNNTVDASALTFLHVDVYSQSAATSFEIQIRDIGANGEIETNIFTGFPEGDDKDYRFTVGGLTPNAWNSFEIPLAGDIATQKNNLGALILAGGPDFILDNIYFYKVVIEPTPNVDDSAATQVALPVGFESTTLTYNFFGFEGAVPAIIPNPDPTGINPTSTVMSSLKSNGAQFFAGNVLDLDAPMDLSTSQKFRMKVWSPKANIPIRLAFETAGGGNQIFVDANVSEANVWEEMEFDFAGVYNPALNYQRIIVFFEFIPGLGGDGSTYYFDDLKILE